MANTFLTMEYIDGEDLASFSHIGRFLRTRLWKPRTNLAGLAAAHEFGLLHRDLKPANIMLMDRAGRIRTSDWPSVATTPLAEAKLRIPSYIAPEQIGKGGASVRTDIYRLTRLL